MAQVQSSAGEVPHLERGHMDISQNVDTYHFFLKLTKWGIISVVAILVLLAIFVA